MSQSTLQRPGTLQNAKGSFLSKDPEKPYDPLAYRILLVLLDLGQDLLEAAWVRVVLGELADVHHESINNSPEVLVLFVVLFHLLLRNEARPRSLAPPVAL